MRNFFYKASLWYFAVIVISFLWFFFLPPSVFGFTHTNWYWELWTWVPGSLFYGGLYVFPLAIIGILLGKSPTSSPTTQLPPSTSWNVWRIIVGAVGAILVAPIAFVMLVCMGTEASSGCGDITFLFLPVYMIAIPVFIGSVVGLLISDFRRK